MRSGVTTQGRSFIVLIAFFALFSAVSAGGEDRTASLENHLAKEEFALAKTPSLYFIIYLKSKAIALKSRGMTLQEWKIKSIHAWGNALPLSALTLEKKSSLFPPKRAKITPAAKEEEAATFELDALELKDMPSRFTLFLGSGTRVLVRPRARGFFPRLGNIGHLVVWNVWIPLKNLFLQMRKKPFGSVDIKLENKEDAQSLYWALPDGIKGLAFPL